MKHILFFIGFIFANKLFAQPVITSFSPTSGPVGTVVTITGNNFNITPANNIVWFGAVKATVTAATSTSLTVTAPAGTTYQPISVTAGGLTAFSNEPFVITYAGGANAFTSGSFAGPQIINTNDTTTRDNVLKDLDGDGKVDIIYLSQPFSQCYVRRNTSNGSNILFGGPIELLSQTGGYYSAGILTVAVEDLNGDGKADILFFNPEVSKFLVFPNTSTIGNISFSSEIEFATAGFTTEIAVSDLNNDGKPDVVIVNNGENYISIFKNTSSSGLISFEPNVDFVTGVKPYNVIFEDFDKDGKKDVAVSTNEPFRNSIDVFRNNSNGGNISLLPKSEVTTLQQQQALLAAGDFDLDAKPDIVIGIGQIEILRNISTVGNIAFQSVFASNNSIQYASGEICVNDLNGDGKPDITIATYFGPPRIYKNITTGNISFEEPVFLYPINSGSPFNGQYIDIADLDGDGKSDIISTENDYPTGNTYVNIAIARNKTNEVSIAKFEPNTGDSGTVVYITGANFNNASSVSFGGTHASSFTVISSDSIQAVVGAGSTGIVSVSTPLGTDTLGVFTYLYDPPVINTFTPTSAVNGSTVVIRGSNFYTVQNVTFGGKPSSSFTVINDSTISAVVQGGLPGSVAVTTLTGQASLPGFSYLSTVITSFNPTSAITGDTISIYGYNFQNASQIKLGNSIITNFTIVSDTVIRAVVGSGASGYVYVASPQGADSLAGFTYLGIPQIISFTPDTASYQLPVYIIGNNFSAVQSVSFGGIPAFNFSVISDTLIIASADTGATGFITVSNLLAADSLAGFTYVRPPIVNSFFPMAARTGDTVTIIGNHFNFVNSIYFGSVPASSFIIISDTLLKAVVGNGASGSVSLASIAGGGVLAGFTFIPKPTISYFTPTSAASGDTVTIVGSNFSQVVGISFGNIAASSFDSISPSVLKAVVANGATGSIKVTNNGGTDSLSGFTYSNPPIITYFTPLSGDTGTVVTINGSRFNGATAVSFGGTPAVSFTVVSNNVITAMVGNGTTGGVNVTTPDGNVSFGTITVLPYQNSVDLNLCSNSNTSITSNFAGISYQWQVNTGNGFVNIINNANYAGVTNRILQINNTPSAWYGYKYRCFINSNHYSRQTVIKFFNIWTGAVSNEWENPANWSCGTVPDVNTDVIINSGTVVIISNAVIRSLTIGPGVNYTVTAPNTVTILGANSATGILGGTPGSCTPFIVSGTYNQEVALNNSNTVQIQVNVTSTGPYAITTNTAGGATFYKTGTFTSTGLQTVVLQGRGAPGLSGNRNFTVTFGNSSCSFILNIIPVAPNYIPTTLNSNWSYDVTSTSDPDDSVFIRNTPNFLNYNGQTYRDVYLTNNYFSTFSIGHRKNANNYYAYFNDYGNVLSLNLISITGEIKQLDENAAVGGTWINNITGWVNGGSQNAPIRVQATVLEKGVTATLATGLNFNNVIKVRHDYYDMDTPSFPLLIQWEERWFAFGIGLIRFQSSASGPFSSNITYQLKRYQVN